MSQLDYNVGDQLYIFTSGSWGPGGYSTAMVKKITAAGQIVTERDGTQRRFMPSGKEVGGGGSAWRSGPWIEPKAKAAERAAMIRQENAKIALKRDTRAELETLMKLDPNEEQADLIAGLRALADKLSQTEA